MKIFTVIGARPQFIKAAVVSRAFAEHRPDVREILVHTGKHYNANMSDVFFDESNTSCPHHTIGVGRRHTWSKQWLHAQKANAVLNTRMVLAYGDTVSLLADVKCSFVSLSN